MSRNKQTTIIGAKGILEKRNQEIWERLEKLAREINRLNKKKISFVEILLKERKSKN
jgi:DNA/RNA endonuclease G (NUC1)